MNGTTNPDLIIEHLDLALAELLAARLEAAQSLPEPVLPEEALDLALQRHEAYQAARRAFSQALAAVEQAVGEENRSLVLDLEAAANGLVGQGCETAWALAWMAAAPRRG